jgi:glycosyltransferase involved in cell wall biosynthesis
MNFEIQISTRNRIEDLSYTLREIAPLLNDNVSCVIYDDGSSDGTSEYIRQQYPDVVMLSNTVSRGYLYCRNTMLNLTKADVAISLDDDAHFLSDNPIEYLQKYFENHIDCGVIAMRIFWGMQPPGEQISIETPHRVKGFVGCGHAWRIKAWKEIPDYPEWFGFYGEEDFSSYELFRTTWKINYVPQVLVNHRVNPKKRKLDADYTLRLRRSLRSGWYLLFLFYPLRLIPRRLIYSLWIQLKTKVFKGDLRALKSIILALIDVFLNIFRIMKYSNRLTLKEFREYENLPDTKIFWSPK